MVVVNCTRIRVLCITPALRMGRTTRSHTCTPIYAWNWPERRLSTMKMEYRCHGANVAPDLLMKSTYNALSSATIGPPRTTKYSNYLLSDSGNSLIARLITLSN